MLLSSDKVDGTFVESGYALFFDNFHKFVKLLNDLLCLGTPACVTSTENRKGFLQTMKNGNQWTKMKAGGDMRWSRENHCLCVQWVDNKVATLLSTVDCANEFVEWSPGESESKSKMGKITVKRPYVIERYNAYMNAVEKLGQMLSKYNLLRKCVRC